MGSLGRGRGEEKRGGGGGGSREVLFLAIWKLLYPPHPPAALWAAIIVRKCSVSKKNSFTRFISYYSPKEKTAKTSAALNRLLL